MEITKRAYAKLNLSMEVISKRADGYHDIKTVMDFISLYDEVVITKSENFSFWCDDEKLSNDENLCVKAYNALAVFVDLPAVDIKLYKKVPYQSGMGSGSADCAATLVALCEMFDIKDLPKPLTEIARSLGADVPACLASTRLHASGIGEQIKLLPHNTKFFYNVVMPTMSFSTAEMYKKIDSGAGYSCNDKEQQLISALKSGAANEVAHCFYNDFWRVAEPKAVLQSCMQALNASGALNSSMTGAGSAVFGIYQDEQTSIQACEKLRAQGLNAFNCCSIL